MNVFRNYTTHILSFACSYANFLSVLAILLVPICSLIAFPHNAVTTIPNRFDGRLFEPRILAASPSADTVFDLQFQGYKGDVKANSDSSIFVLKSWSVTSGKLISTLSTVGFCGLKATTDLNSIVNVANQPVFINVRGLSVLRLYQLPNAADITDLSLPYPIVGPVGCLFTKLNSLMYVSANGKSMLIDVAHKKLISNSYLVSLLNSGYDLKFGNDEWRAFLFKDDKTTLKRRTLIFDARVNMVTDSLDSEYRSAFDASSNCLVKLTSDTTIVVQSLDTRLQSVIRTDKTVDRIKLCSSPRIISIVHKDSTLSSWDITTAQKSASASFKVSDPVWNSSGTEVLCSDVAGLTVYNTLLCNRIAQVPPVGIPQGFAFASDSVIWYTNDAHRTIFVNIVTRSALHNINSFMKWNLSSNLQFILLDSVRIIRLPLQLSGTILKVPNDNGLIAPITQISVRADGKKIASVSDLLRIHECESGALVCQRSATDIDNIIWCPDSSRIFCHRLDATLLVLSGENLDSVASIRTPIDPRVLAFSLDGTLLLTAQADSTISIRHTSDLRIIKSIRSNAKAVSAAISYDNKTVAFLGQDDRVSLWDTSKTAANMTPPPAYSNNSIYRFSPQGKFVVTEAGILSLDTKRLIQLPTEVIPNVSLRYCGIYKQDSIIVVSTDSGIAQIEASSNEITLIPGSRSAICHPDYYFAMRSLEADTIESTLFSLDSRRDTITTRDFQPASSPEWSSNGNALAAIDADYSLKIWLNDVVKSIDSIASSTDDFENDRQGVFVLSPNPSNNVAKLQLKGNGSTDIELRTMLGSLLYSTTSNSQSVVINTSLLAPGPYLLNARQNGNISQSQILVVVH